MNKKKEEEKKLRNEAEEILEQEDNEFFEDEEEKARRKIEEDRVNFDVNGEKIPGIDMELLDVTKLKYASINLDHMTREEIRDIVNIFYQVQDMRKSLANQIRALEPDKSAQKTKNESILRWVLAGVQTLENGIEEAMDTATNNMEIGRWLKQICGIGPILAAGIIGYFDVKKANYASGFHSYAGLCDNVRPWLGKEKSRKLVEDVLKEEGKKTVDEDVVTIVAARSQWKYDFLRKYAYNPKNGKWSKDKLIKAVARVPYNRGLKTFMWKVGYSFHMVCNNDSSVYGRLFNERRVLETQKNEAGDYADQAKKILESKNWNKETVAYKEYTKGKLPKAHITNRALRWANKIFLAHVFEEMYRLEYHKEPPRPYVLEHQEGKHNDYIEPEIPFTAV